MRITTVQAELAWENIDTNLAHFTKLILPLAGETDLVVLPEMFTTGFSMQPAAVAEEMTGKSMSWLRKTAAKIEAVITGSLVIKADGKYFNRLVWMRPDGTFDTYNKKHLFTLAGEHKNYEAGEEVKIIEYKGRKICPLICYDLRFPVWSRNVSDYDLLLYVANWPATRSLHWKILLAARAVENQSYTIGVNRVGKDANDLVYAGDTSVIDYAGNVLHTTRNRTTVFTVKIDFAAQDEYRSKLNFLRDRDYFAIKKSPN